MITQDVARPRAASTWPPPVRMHDEAAARVVAGLDDIDVRSRRRLQSGLYRALRKLGGTFGNWLERPVPATPRPGVAEPPAEIRFPFF